MNILTEFVDIIIKAFSISWDGIVIAIPKIPHLIRNFDSDGIKVKIDADNKGYFSHIRGRC